MEQVGFVGLGIMGRAMVSNLLKHGCTVLVNDISQAAVDAAVAGGAVAATLAEIASACKTIFLSLPSGTISKQVLFGRDGLYGSLQKGALVADTSSITPQEAMECAETLALVGVSYLDCPVSGCEPGAVAGTLAFMVGGEESTFQAAMPYLEMMGSSALLTGPVGSGSVTKLANQIIVNLTIAAVSEAMVFATKAGVCPERVYQAIRGGLAGSTVLEQKAPKMFNRDFAPGGKISINHKDIRNVLDAAHRLDVPVPFSAQLFEIMQSLKIAGYENEDHSGLVHYYERLADLEVKKGGV